jgi:hypothetical protein
MLNEFREQTILLAPAFICHKLKRISRLPPYNDNFSDEDFVEVFSTYQQGDIAFLKSILDEEDITYFFQGESSIMLIAAGAYARLLVKSDEAPRAKEILQDLGFIEKV